MTTRLDASGPSPGVVATESAPRLTPAPARPFKQVLHAGAQVMFGGAEAAVRRLPAGPILAAAVRPGAGAPGGMGAPVGRTGGYPGAGARAEGSAGTAEDGSTGTPSSGVEGMISENADMNLYYLELQERISAESRAYSTMSNVLKARHDTVKNAIGNIR